MEININEIIEKSNIGDMANVRIGDKQAVYRFDGENWVLMEVWRLVEDGPFDKVITPDPNPSSGIIIKKLSYLEEYHERTRQRRSEWL